MNWGPVFIRLPDACTLLTSSRTIGYEVVVLVLCLAGCIQDSPPSSSDRAVSLLLELLHDERPEMRRTAAESLGKIGDPSVVPEIYIVPSVEVSSLIYQNPGGNRRVVPLGRARKKWIKYKDAWSILR